MQEINSKWWNGDFKHPATLLPAQGDCPAQVQPEMLSQLGFKGTRVEAVQNFSPLPCVAWMIG
eukprot:SAG11_NODE_4186_length_2023_cov_3.093035_1_plen_63_part_00